MMLSFNDIFLKRPEVAEVLRDCKRAQKERAGTS